MSVSPQIALLDQPVTVSLRGLPADARTTVLARATDAGGKTWSASADFRATSAGMVSLNQPAEGGAYSGANPMGLFEFMTPWSSDSTDTVFISPRLGYDVTLSAKVNGRVVVSTTAHRQTSADIGVAAKELRPAAGGIYGQLYLPKGAAVKRPAVLVFGGSEGGLGSSPFAASLLAAHGYPSLALAYFNEPGLPGGLANIALEYFAKALDVLRAQPGVDLHHVLVMGVSRGGEAALLVGAQYPHLVDGVIAGVPSSVVNPGYPDASQPAWTLHGRPLPAVSLSEYKDPAPAKDPQAVIPVERIAGPILLTCGEQDGVWPSCPYIDAITRRLHAHHFAYPVIAAHYPDAGHFSGILVAFFSVTAAAVARGGGSLAGNQSAQADGHTKLLAFLKSQ